MWMKNVGLVGFHKHCLRNTAEEHKSHDRVHHGWAAQNKADLTPKQKGHVLNLICPIQFLKCIRVSAFDFTPLPLLCYCDGVSYKGISEDTASE